MKKENTEYIKAIIELESKYRKQPNLWVSELYKLQHDEIFKKMNDVNLSKDEFTELSVLEWLMYLSPKIFRHVKKSTHNNNLHFSTQNDISKPDIKIGQEWYELTFAELQIFKFKNGTDYENHILQENTKEEMKKIEKAPGRLILGKKEATNVFIPKLVMQNKANKIMKAISRKSKKNYDVEEKINLVIYSDRNLNHDITIQSTIIKFLITEHWDDLCIGLKKFKNIYILTEDKINNENFIDKKLKRAVLTTMNNESIQWFQKNINLSNFSEIFYKCPYVNWMPDLEKNNKKGYIWEQGKLKLF